MGVGGPNYNFEIISKKRLFFQFRGIKNKFHHIWPPWNKFWEYLLLAPPGKILPTPMLSLNWQLLKVLIVKFQASTLDQCHHLLINLSCKSASKPANAQYCTWARSHRGRHYDCAYTVFTRFWCTPTPHVQSKPSSDFARRHRDFQSRSSTKLSRIEEVDPVVI